MHPITPDGHYFVVRERLWRMADPTITPDRKQELVRDLMAARRAVKVARDDPEQMAQARAAVNSAKVALGERGPPWWTDGTPDLNRRMVRSTPYAQWFGSLAENRTALG